MRLCLHIGSYKTASTSVQYYLANNRKLLISEGYYYPKNRNNVHVSNDLALQLVDGRNNDIAKFLNRVHRIASSNGCHTAIISAEFFFAMTSIHFDLRQRNRLIEDYYENERRLVTRLREHCSKFDCVQVACYLRSQEELATSLYNQFVKNVYGISYSFERFCREIEPMLDYHRLLGLWEAAFGNNSIAIRSYLESRQDPVGDFCRSFLNLNCLTLGNKRELHMNERLTRDILEFKREYNETDRDRALAIVATKCLTQLSTRQTDQPGYQAFSSPEFRHQFFQRFVKGNNRVVARYALPNLPAHGDAAPTYPGLSEAKKREIRSLFEQALARPEMRVEIALRRIFHRVLAHVPGGDHVIELARRWHSQLKLWNSTP